MEQYQDQWINGHVYDRGVRECASRYEALRPLLSQYTRPFTVLDLGASLGYFTFRITEEFPLAVVVAIDDDRRLFYQCQANESNRVVHLRKRMTESDLRQLANCEHFDVTLALNVVHHFDGWESVLQSLWQMGDHLIIETPENEPGCINYDNALKIYATLLDVEDKELLTETPSHIDRQVLRPMWYFRTPGNTLRRAYFTAPEGLELGGVTIDSNFFTKRVTLHRKNESRDWIHGINLQTYLSLNGQWPHREVVARAIESFPHPRVVHGDVTPWNFILGEGHLGGWDLHLIDGRDDRAVQPIDDFHKVAQIVRVS